MQPYLQAKNREIRRCMVKCRTGSHWLEIQGGRFTKPQTERENTLCKQCSLGVVKDEAHVVFVCPLYETLRVQYSELFGDAKNLNSAFSSAEKARFLYDCYLMHVESSLAPLRTVINSLIHSFIHSKCPFRKERHHFCAFRPCSGGLCSWSGCCGGSTARRLSRTRTWGASWMR
jgi:hypothetical protein